MVSGTVKKNRISAFFAQYGCCLLSFFTAAAMMLLTYYLYEVYPFGERTVLWSDLEAQYAPLFTELRNRVLNGQSLIYSWNTGLGGPFLGNFFNYLSGTLTPVTLLFDYANVDIGISIIILIKPAVAAALFSLYLKKTMDGNGFVIAGFGLLYAFCGWFVAFYWNVMWLDAYSFFPMIMYGIERLIKNGKPFTYIFFLALTIITNYYMGYMCCIFSALWFLTCYFSNHKLAEKIDVDGKVNNIKQNLFIRRGFAFACASLVAAGISAFVLFPVFVNLQQSSATSGVWPEKPEFLCNFLKIVSYHFAGVEATFSFKNSAGYGLPNVYSGIITLVLVPIFFASKKACLREKIVSLLLILFMLLSFSLNYLSYIWHGFHFTNDLPHRFSFMYSFILLVLAYKAISTIHLSKYKNIVVSGVFIIALIAFCKLMMSEEIDNKVIIVSIVFTVVCTIVLVIYKQLHSRNVIGLFLLFCIVSELAYSNGGSYILYNKRADYLSNCSHLIQSQRNNVFDKNDTDFFRTELKYNDTSMTGAKLNYKSVSVFSSMSYENMTQNQIKLGLKTNMVNSYTYSLQTPVYNMMHSLKYIVDNDSSASLPGDYLQPVKSGNSYTVYANKYYLPVGIAVSDSIKKWNADDPDPFKNQSSWFSLASGVKGDVFQHIEPQDVKTENVKSYSFNDETGEISYKRNDFDSQAWFTLLYSENKDGYYYCYVKFGKDAFMYDRGFNNGDIEIKYGYMDEDSVSGTATIDLCRVNNNLLNEGYKNLKQGQMNVEYYDDTHIKGAVTAKQDQVMYFSIPYDKGWRISVDGKPISDDAYLAVGGAYLGCEIPEGEHTVELEFHQRGLAAGVTVSAISLVILSAWIVIRRKKGAKIPAEI